MCIKMIWECAQGRVLSMAAPQPPPPPSTRGGLFGAIQSGVTLKKVRISATIDL